MTDLEKASDLVDPSAYGEHVCSLGVVVAGESVVWVRGGDTIEYTMPAGIVKFVVGFVAPVTGRTDQITRVVEPYGEYLEGRACPSCGQAIEREDLVYTALSDGQQAHVKCPDAQT